MIVTSKIRMDLANRGVVPVVYAVQSDEYSRNIELHLTSNGVALALDNATTVSISYEKPDGTRGIYDKMPDGGKAWSIEGNVVTVAIAPQALTVDGDVEMSVGLALNGATIHSFPVILKVDKLPGFGGISEDYIGVSFLPAITEDDNYKVLTALNGVWRAMKPSAGTSSRTWLVPNLTSYECLSDGISLEALAGADTPTEDIVNVGDMIICNDGGVLFVKEIQHIGSIPIIISTSGTGDFAPAIVLKGENGDPGPQGDPGPAGKDGLDATPVTPLFANTIAECTDPTKFYVLPDGYIYAYMTGGTATQTVTEQIVGTTDNPWSAGRLSSGDPNGTSGYVTTPYIDLTKYSVPFELHLEGIAWVYTSDGNRRYSQYNTSKSHIKTEMNSSASFTTNWRNAVFTANSGDTAVISFTPPVTNASGTTVGYARFSGQGTEANAKVYVTYEKEVSASGWKNTGHAFIPADYEDRILALEQAVADDVNIGTFTLANPSAKAFMATEGYTDGDYSYTNVTIYAGSDYYRKDQPFPAIIGWNKHPNAVQYTVTINTASGVLNTGMQTYYTKDNRLPVWNLIPGKTYYYKVYALCADGTSVLIKSSSFTTAADKTRMLNIDGIQNVRDIGGYSGAGSKKVKYGALYRGSCMDEAIQSNLRITDMGKQEMVARVGIKTDLDLRGANNVTESALGNGVDFYAPPYSYLTYATAITDATHRGYFKTMFEYIVTQLTASKPVYIHCSGGCDRTGTFVFLLMGLLGVSESDLAKEYELSSLSAIGAGRTRNSTTYDYKGMVAAIKAYSGSTLADKFVAFATACGIESTAVTNFRNLMLE